jgi:signal transduction histidine kinase
MDKALEGAIEAGAEGGQVCLADKSINLILGSKVGRARNRSGGKQRWDLVVAETIVPLPGCEERVRLPESLRATMLSAGHRPTGSQLRDLDDEDDVLKIVSIERSPLFVPDSNDKSFHCHSGRTSLGSLEAQFVSPMLGSGDDLIGTFQVGFVKNHPMDRERMGLWTGYSQKVAAALERALEFGERRRLEAITEVWNSILQAPTPVGNPDPLLEAFTAEVQKQLGAYYVHLRVRELVNGVVCYRLVAPASELGALHRRVRKYTGTGDEGSVAIAEKREPRFTNCKKETDDLLGLASRATFEAATGEDQHRWKKESGRLRSVGVVALHYGEDFLGALVVDSEDEYFFTERRRRLSELAAAKASLILAKLRAETRLQQVVYRGLYAADNVHNIMQPLVNVQLGIEALLGSGLDQKTATSLNVLLGENARTMGLLKNAAKGSEIGESPMPLGELLSSTIKLGIAVEWQSNDDKRAVLRANLFLRSAIKRLAENAIEAAGTTDKVWPRVSRAREGMILIEIENAGPEVTASDIEKMFVFGHSTKKDHLGLGVPLADFGIRLAGGRLDLQPRSGGGLRAFVQLPLAAGLAI